MKFYGFDFNKGSSDKIQIVIPKTNPFKPIQKIYVETILAIFLKKLINTFEELYLVKQKDHRIILSINGNCSHPYRYSLKESLNLLNKKAYFINNNHCRLLSHYFSVKETLKKS